MTRIEEQIAELTPAQIEKLRDDIKDRQPSYDDGEIDALCDAALRSAPSSDGVMVPRELSQLSFERYEALYEDTLYKVKAVAMFASEHEQRARRAVYEAIIAECAAPATSQRDCADAERLKVELRGEEAISGALLTVLNRYEQALRIIAGEQQCIDNLMSDKDIARAALDSAMRADGQQNPAGESTSARTAESEMGNAPLTPAGPADVREAAAWLHQGQETAYVITDRVKEIWLTADPKHVENYTIPLYRVAP